MMRVSYIVAAMASVSAAFNLSSKSNVATYWGQGPNQARLIETCKNPSFDIVNIGFVNVFPDQGAGGYPGDNFGNACYGDVYEHNGVNTSLLKTCPYIGDDVIACQQTYGKKIFLSLGGGYPTNYYIANDTSGKSFGDFLWQAFGPVPTATTGVPRPWGNAVVDGFDFDIESVISPAPKDSNGNTIAYQTSGYAAMINHFKNDLYPQDTSKSYYISGAPQCVLPDVHLTDVIKVAWFDFIWPQFYNTAQCSARAGINHMNGVGTNDISFGSWESSTSLNKNVKLFLGLPASTAAAIDPSYYLNVSEAQRLVNRFSGTAQFGGVMVWEATYSANNVICGLTYGDWIKRIVLGLSTSCTTSTTSSTTATSTTSKTSSTLSKTSSTSSTTSSKTSSTSSKTSTTSSKTTSTSSKTSTTSSKTTSTSSKTSSTSTAKTSTTSKTTSTSIKTTSTTVKTTSTSTKVTSTTSKTSSTSKTTTTSKASTTIKPAAGKARNPNTSLDDILSNLPSTEIQISLHPTLIDTTITIIGSATTTYSSPETQSVPSSSTTSTSLSSISASGTTPVATGSGSAASTSSIFSTGVTSSAISAGISTSGTSARVTSSAVSNATLTFTRSPPKSYTTFTTMCTETKSGSTYVATHTHSAPITASTVSAGVTSSVGFNATITSGSHKSYTTFTTLCTETKNGSTYLATHTHSAPVKTSSTPASVTGSVSSSYAEKSYTTFTSLCTETRNGTTYLATHTHSAPVTPSVATTSATASEIMQTLVTSIYTTVCPVTATWTIGSSTLISTYSTISTATSIYSSPISPVHSTASVSHSEMASYGPAPSASYSADQQTTVTDYTTSWTTVCPATSTVTHNGWVSLSTYVTTSTVVSVIKTTIIVSPTGYATAPASTPGSSASEAGGSSWATFPSAWSTTKLTAQTYAASSTPLASFSTAATPSEYSVGAASPSSSVVAPEQYSAPLSSTKPSPSHGGPEQYSPAVSSASPPQAYGTNSSSASSTETVLETMTVMPMAETSVESPVSAPVATPYPVGTNGTWGATGSASASASVLTTAGWSASASSAVPYTGGAGMNVINVVGLLAGGAVVSLFLYTR